MLKAKFKNMYRTKSGRQMFVYNVTGTAAELAQYKEAQAEHYVEDEATGHPLYFSSRMLSYNRKEAVELMITTAGKVVVDETDKVFDRAARLDEATITEEAKLLARQNLGLSNGEKAEAVTTATQTAARQVELEAVAAEVEDAEIVDELNDEPAA